MARVRKFSTATPQWLLACLPPLAQAVHQIRKDGRDECSTDMEWNEFGGVKNWSRTVVLGGFVER